MKTATLVYVKGEQTDTFRVVTAEGKLLFATRCDNTPDDIAAARLRLLAYATDTQTCLLDTKGNVAIEPADATASTRAERRTWGRPLLQEKTDVQPAPMPSRRTWGRS